MHAFCTRPSYGFQMTQGWFRTLGVAVPWANCTLVPTLIFGLLLGQWGTNLIWGHIFGLGWFIAQSYFGPQGWRIAAWIGVFVWPPIVMLALFRISGSVWRSERRSCRHGFLAFLILSSLPILPAQTIERLYSGGGVPADFNVLLNSY
jgi:hypothetical protein